MEQDNQAGLGRYTGILAVDVRDYSKHTDMQQRRISELLFTVLGEAAERAGLPGLLDDSVLHVFRAFRGDGYLIGFDPDLMATMVDRYVDALQAALRRRAPGLRAEEIELRLRVSLHLGPVGSFDKLIADSPSGRLLVDSGRMVDAAPVRALLAHSDPAVTLVAAVLSEEVMKQVVEAGRTARKPSEFVAAPLRIEAKDYSGKGYLRVPVPSGELLCSGLLHGQPEPAPESEETTGTHAESARVANAVTGRAERVLQAATISGGVHDHSVGATSGGIAVRGDHNVTAGGDIDQSSGKQEFSGSFTTWGDSNFGSHSGRRITTRTGEEDR